MVPAVIDAIQGFLRGTVAGGIVIDTKAWSIGGAYRDAEAVASAKRYGGWGQVYTDAVDFARFDV